MSARLLAAQLSMVVLAATATARAEDPVLTLHGEGAAEAMLTERYSDRFDWGGGGALRVGLEVAGPLAVQAGLAAAWFPVRGQDPGNLWALELGARGFFPLGGAAGGPFVDVNAGAGITGSLVRVVFDAAVGWDFFPIESLGLGPVVRYRQIVQPDDQAVADDAAMLLVGIDVTLRIDLGSPEPERIVVERAVAPPPAAPPPDQDGDTIDDAHDRCRDVAEDADGNADDDGCPDPDDDSDGFPDAEDRCPRAPETRNGIEDEDGCPDETRATPTHREIGEELPETVLFRVGSDRVSPRFADAIQSVCRTLSAQPGVRLRVVGHADEQGTPAGNHRLGAARAGAVAEQLVLCGIDPQRLESTSYGDTRPACEDTADEACMERNRRVGFEILRPR